MKVRNLMLSSAFALMGFLAACNENPVVEPGTGPANLKASSKSATEVSLMWDAVAGATSYEVSWLAVTPSTGSGTNTETSTTSVATSLSEGVMYDFKVRANTASGLGDATTIRWSPAARPTKTGDPLPNQNIRIYEKASANESGLHLDVNGVPMRVTLNMTKTEPNKAQLAMFIYARIGNPAIIDSLIVGPAYALIEYAAANQPTLTRIDKDVYISAGTTPGVSSLDSWYLSAPLSGMIATNSNVMAYKFDNAQISSATGHGFIVRTGTTASDFHYARVLIKSIGGSLVAGPTNDRYVELEISYQHGVNVPFAKAGPVTYGVMATPGHRRIIN